MAYVSNAGWLDGNAADGMRACLTQEFTDLYVFHLRGNARTSGERRRKEKGNVFGEGTWTPIAISVFVKNPDAVEHGRIFFHDIGDYLDQKQKLAIIRDFGAVKGISKAKGWEQITPDDQNDWLNQRDASFDAFMKIGDKKDKSEPTLFMTYSRGVATGRDSWTYNFSRGQLTENIKGMIRFYNDELERTSDMSGDPTAKLNADTSKISWSAGLKADIEKRRKRSFDEGVRVPSIYRPFDKEWLYYGRSHNERVYLMPSMFPDDSQPNRVIGMSGPGFRGSFSVLMADTVPALHAADRDGAQCFPLYLYDQQDEEPGGLFECQSFGLRRRDAITDAGLGHFQAVYPGEEITKADIFYYVYGLLHSPDYRGRYADNLAKELPRIPCVKSFADFCAFSEAGRRLGDLHVNYATVEPYPVTIKQGDLRTAVIKDPEAFYRVTRMKFAGKRGETDKSTVIYNASITMQDIPLEAYDYVVNGKPALEWVMERQVVKRDKDSGIVNDANRYAIETVGNPAYPLELFQRVITVSLETMKIVRSLLRLEIAERATG